MGHDQGGCIRPVKTTERARGGCTGNGRDERVNGRGNKMKGTAEWMETFASIEFRPFDDYEWEVYAVAECPEHGTVELEPIIGEAETVVLDFGELDESVNVVEVCADAN